MIRAALRTLCRPINTVVDYTLGLGVRLADYAESSLVDPGVPPVVPATSRLQRQANIDLLALINLPAGGM